MTVEGMGDSRLGGHAFLSGGGEMGDLIRALDWSATALGPPDGWPQSLRSAVSILLPSRAQICLFWGQDFITLYNDPYRPTLGIKHPRALGQPASEVWKEFWADVLQPLLERVRTTGEAFWGSDFPFFLERHGYPEETYFDISYDPVRDESGAVGGVFCIVSETSGRVIGERRLRTLRDLGRLASASQTVHDAFERAAEVLGANPQDVPFALVYGWDEEAADSPCIAACNIDRLPGSRWPLARAGREEVVLHAADLLAYGPLPGGPWPESARAVVILPIVVAGQKPFGVLVCGVSPRRELAEPYRDFLRLAASNIAAAASAAHALEEQRARAEALAEIDRLKTTFFSNVSHEFRTPLTLMLGPVEQAANDPQTPPAARAHLELAHRNALRLLKLVNSLLDFSRIEAGRVEASYQPTDLSAHTRDLASTFRSAIERAGLHFTVQCDDVGEPVFVDPEMYEKIVLNLLSNAFKFTFEGEIAVRLRRGDRAAVLEVTDTGAGIADAELSRIFDRFHRVQGAVGRTQEGSGIGLALVQELVRLHGGSIQVRSQPGRGSTFEVRLPLGSAHLPERQIRAVRSQSSTAVGAQAFVQEVMRWTPDASADTGRMGALVDEPGPAHGLVKAAGARVLLADDNADMRAYLRDLLSPGYVVQAVADGEQALTAASRERPDLILADIMMPRLDGLALLKALRANDALRDIPVILLSARAGEEARVEGLDAGADDYLVKPFSARELLARVGALLELTTIRRENEERLRAFLSATSDVIYRMSPDWMELRHLEGRNFIADTTDPSRTWLERYIHPDDQPLVLDAARQAIRTGEVFQLEHRVRRVDGALGWAFSRAIPLKDADGNIVEWFGAASDVTERKLSEQRLREREEALRQTHAALEARTAELARFNQAAVGRELRIIELKEEINRLGERLGEEARYRTAFEEPPTPLPAAPHSAGERVARLEGTPRNDDLRAALNLLEDAVSARRLAEQSNRKLREREEALREADQRKNEFLALLGHELRNPLSPISTASDLLSRLVSEDPKVRVAAAMIKRQGAQLTRLVDDLLDVGRITQGRIQLQRQPTDLSKVIRDAIETVDAQFRQKRHQVSVACSREPLYVQGDPARLVQCVVNVLSNAAKYTDPRGQIHVRTRAEGQHAVIEVSDTGVGIAPELQPRLFDLFVQGARTLDRSQGGLGIGLSVVKRLIDMHDGQVTVRSEGAGRGSTFEIRLPRIAGHEPPDSSAPPTEARARRVLIVDDNMDAANSLAMLLSSSGHHTQVAYSGREALERVDSFRPDVAFLDIGLPGMTGYELARKLRSLPHLDGLRLIALTGYGLTEDRQNARAAGFDDHLVKPADLQTLQRAMGDAPAVREAEPEKV